MVAFNVVGRFLHQNELRPYRRQLAAEVAQDFTLRLLPALLALPLPITGPDGSPHDLSAALRETPRVTLAGASGSGRRLALQQLVHHWATNEAATGPIPVLLALPRLDDDRSSPSTLLAPWTQPTGQMPDPKPHRGRLVRLRLSAAPPEPQEQPIRWLLLIQGWEELPPERRAKWRSALCDAPLRWPELHLAVALPQEEPAWPGFAPLMIGAPTPALLEQWIERLAPADQRAALLDALAPDGGLHPLGGRLFEVALLAWLAAHADLPGSRADLYGRALKQILDMQPVQLARASVLAELQLLAAYGEWPSFSIPGLLEPKDGGTPRFAHPQARRYLAARQLVEEQRYDLLHTLAQAERDELALLIATMRADPTRLYAALWASGQLRPQDALALGRCLRERTPASPSWTLRVIGALARLARAGATELRPVAYDLLVTTMPVLDAVLPVVAGVGESIERTLLRLLDSLPDDLIVPRLELLAYDGATPERLAWEVVDRLLAQPASDDRPLPSDPAALARWAYIQALRGPQSRQRLDPAIAATALPALAASAAGDTRRLRAAGALLDDPALPVGTQIAALGLIAGDEHPSALGVIERAIHDEAADIRRRAIEALADRAPQDVFATLSRTALDETAPWDTRLSAIQRLGDHLATGAGALLQGYTSNLALPLYARTQAVAAFGRDAAALPHLLAVAGDAACHPEVRAAAARRLGAAGHHDALDGLLRLLADPATPAPLAEAICDGLGTMGTGHARGWRVRGALLRTIESATSDVALTLAAVRALGLLGDAEAIEPLSRLLGAEALARLQRGPHLHLLQQAAEACLDAPSLAWHMSLRLASACAEGSTPADRPTTLAEFLSSEADLLRAGAAASLAAIGGDGPRAALLNALLSGAGGGATAELIATLAEAEGQTSAETLGSLLVAAEANPLTRWLAVRHLADDPAGEEVMRQVLARGDVDPFTRGALAEALGQRGDPAAIPLLLQIADDHTTDAHLRSQAVLALGLLDQPATEPALMRLIGNQTEDQALRGLAAEHLPSALSEPGRRQLRDMLRRERLPAPIVVGMLRALKRARDRESLPLMLRYAQDEATDVAQAGIGALAELGDNSVTPDLVRISLSPGADRAVRLEAVGALLRLGGSQFRPLLQPYLDQGALPLRLQALEHLIAADDSPNELLAILAARARPLLLRLRALERLGDDPYPEGIWLPALLGILQDGDDDTHLRCLAVEAIGRARHVAALPLLIALAERADTPHSVRLRCINAIGAIGGTESWLALSRLAENNARMPIIRHWAALALRDYGARTANERT